MPPTNDTALQRCRSALLAISELWEGHFNNLESVSGRVALTAHAEIEHAPVAQKSARFFRSFSPLRQEMVDLLAETYRRFFKVALAQSIQTGIEADQWAWSLLQPAVRAALEWIREWYILACEGQNQRVRHVGTMDFAPGSTASLSIPITPPPIPPETEWRAPAWLFGISAAYFGIGRLKQQNVPNMDSEERLGEGHTRLLLRGARRVFLWEVGAAIETVRNEEIAAAGALRPEPSAEQRRQPNKRKGWEQREKLYRVIRNVLASKPELQGMGFCGELDKRHAEPLLDWIENEEWRPGLTWKEAWGIPELRRKIRRVRQEAQKKS